MGKKHNKTMYTYFLEHKTLRTWLTFDGELTNNPTHSKLWQNSHKDYAENELKQRELEYSHDFSGTRRYINQGSQIALGLQGLLKENAMKNGFDLFNDFIVTEHEFVSQKN